MDFQVLVRTTYLLLWVGFGLYGFLLAPPPAPDTLELVLQLSTAQWSDINPWVVALFNLMGVLPLIYCCLLFADGRGQRFPAWPFVALSFVVGAFGLLPYLALRNPQPTLEGPMDRTLSLFDSRWMGLLLSALTLLLLGYGLLQGDGAAFLRQWRTDRFIHVMSLDFCLLCLLFPCLLGDDMARRNLQERSFLRVIALVPLLGPLVYLSTRPPLRVADAGQA
jgi:hypothetical protein